MTKKRVSIVIPLYNEEANIPALLGRLYALTANEKVKHIKFDFLFVNDGSTDQTYSLLKQAIAVETGEKFISLVNLSRNFGKEIALTAGLDNCNSDAAVIIDADLQDPPELIPEMIEFWEQGYDDVYARRVSRDGETALKKLTSKLYYRVLQNSTNVPIQVDTGDFRLLNRRCLDALKLLRESNRNNKALFSWIGYSKKEINYNRDSRVAGETKWNYFKLVEHAIDGITSFTTFPLRLATIFGFLISSGSFLYAFATLLKNILYPDGAHGYASTLIIILFLGGIQLLSIGILGEYIGRIFTETKGRPLYYVEEAHLVK